MTTVGYYLTFPPRTYTDIIDGLINHLVRSRVKGYAQLWQTLPALALAWLGCCFVWLQSKTPRREKCGSDRVGGIGMAAQMYSFTIMPIYFVNFSMMEPQ